MALNMIQEFKLLIDAVPWMDMPSKVLAIQKADAIRTQIGYPDNIFNETYMNKQYDVTWRNFILLRVCLKFYSSTFNLKINIDASTLLENFYTLSKREIYNHFGDLRLKKDKDE